MPDSYLAIKVQSIGVIDAVLTASLLSGLIFQSGVALWKNVDEYFEDNNQYQKYTPKEYQYIENGNQINISNVGGGSGTIYALWPRNEAKDRSLKWWWWLFHDVVFGVGLALVLGAALALIRSTSLKVHPSKAIKLVRIWLLGNILVVVIISMSFVSVALTAKVCGGLDVVIAWSIFYLFVRGICAWICWNYLQDLTKQLPTLITAPAVAQP